MILGAFALHDDNQENDRELDPKQQTNGIYMINPESRFKLLVDWLTRKS
jgi:hypothetical protein